MPARLQFAYGQPTCTFNPVLLPRLTKVRSSPTFNAEIRPSVSLGQQPLISFKTCVTVQQLPSPGQQEVIELQPFGNSILKKRIAIAVDTLPEPTPDFAPSAKVGSAATVRFRLDRADTVLRYDLHADSKSSNCTSEGTILSCELSPLALTQGASYQVQLVRSLGTSTALVLETSLTILDPITITDSSVEPGAIMYDAPTSLSLNTSKKLQSLGAIGLINTDSNEQFEGIDYAISDEGLIVQLTEPLPRKTNFELRIDQLEAEDSSRLDAPYLLPFSTSGGPTVSAVNIGSRRVNPATSITLTFDVGLKSDQDFAAFAQVEISGKPIALSIRHSDNKLTLNPTTDLPRCTDFNVRIQPGLVNEFAIGEGEAWQLSARTLCQTSFSIGRSVQGRHIMAYRFGSGASKIVFVGGMHGNEKSSVATLNAFIDYLEDRARDIPAHRSIIVIPNHNPDAYAASRRTNANNVDLNRNWPANDWQSSVQIPGGQTLPQGGGATPLDQPETAALASFINSQQPRLVLTYHAVARVIISNDVGDSATIGQKYAADTRYRFTDDSGSDDEFGYATTGEFEDWLADKKGIPAVLVELAYLNSSEFTAHRSAMWRIVTLP